MAYPRIDKYTEAIQNYQKFIIDKELSTGKLAKTGFGLPIVISGGFALTYTIETKDKKFAVRCFHKESKNLEFRYKEISKKIGELFLVKTKINLHYDLLDTPEFFWEYPQYENQYEKMVKYLDIKSRVEVLNKKVEIIQELLHVLSDEQKHKYSSFLEWIIIILIAFEIIINLKDHFS